VEATGKSCLPFNPIVPDLFQNPFNLTGSSRIDWQIFAEYLHAEEYHFYKEMQKKTVDTEYRAAA